MIWRQEFLDLIYIFDILLTLSSSPYSIDDLQPGLIGINRLKILRLSYIDFNMRLVVVVDSVYGSKIVFLGMLYCVRNTFTINSQTYFIFLYLL